MTHKQSNPDWDLRNVRAFSEKGQLVRWLDVMKIKNYHGQVATYQGEWLYVFDLTKPLTTTISQTTRARLSRLRGKKGII